MVADAEIIDSSVYCFHVDTFCSAINIAIRFERICRSYRETMAAIGNTKKPEYHHSDDVSRYRSVHSQSQISPDRLWIYCSSLRNFLLAQCKSPNQRFQLFDLVSTAYARHHDAFDDSRRCLRTLLWWVHCSWLDLNLALSTDMNRFGCGTGGSASSFWRYSSNYYGSCFQWIYSSTTNNVFIIIPIWLSNRWAR